MELISLPLVLLLISNIHSGQSEALPRATVRVTPDRSVFTGETVTLKCEIENQYRSLNWTYQWYKNITKVFNSGRYTVNRDSLTITGVTESDQDEYWCSAERNGQPPLLSSSVNLSVRALPRVTVRVTPDRSVFTGETVTLKCEIENKYRSLNWTYLWISRRTSVLNSGRYTINRDSLTIKGVTESDQDEYWCIGEIHGRPNASLSSSDVYLTVKGSKPKPKLRSGIEGSVLTGNTVTLKCHIDQSTGWWTFYWYKYTKNTEKTTPKTNSYTINSVKVSDGGQYWCRAGRGKTDYYTDYSDGLWINVTESPKPVVSVDPDKQLFRGETVTLRCDIQDTGDTEWTYSWTVKKTNNRNIITQCNKQECKINNIQYYHSDKYTCRGKIRKQNTKMSDAVTLTVSSDKRPTVLSVSPQQWLTEGDSVTLMCEVINSSTGWTFNWFTVQSLYSVNKYDYELVSNSSGGSKGIYTVSSVTVKHTGVYMCRAERGDPVYHTEYSNTQTLWITGVSPSVSLIIRPNRSQHFSSESLSLSCEDHSNSTGWTVRRYTDKLKNCSSDWRSTGTTSTCTISSLYTSDTGVYWCQSESGEKLHPVNISVHNLDVILDSPVYPVTEGDTLILRCLYRDKKPSNLRAKFYKDGSVVQNQTTRDMMIISTVSKSHEGFYYCKHPERGESPKSWISVRDKPQTVLSVSPQQWLTEGDSVTLMCEVINSSTGWTFSWFTVQSLYSDVDYKLVSVSSGGSEGIYTVSSVTVKHTGVYMCRAERGDPVYHTDSNTQTLWITGVSPSVSLIIRPNRSQHFSSESLSLSCEDHSNSTGWTVRRYTDKLKPCSSSDWRSTGTTSTCTIRSLKSSDTGVYWCQSESGEKLHPVNISVHNVDVILDSPVHPVTEGDPLTLRCLYRDKNPSNLRAEFYKDGLVVQNQTTGDMMIIPTVSKSHEGFYYCKHPERGESPKSWISVRGVYQEMSGLKIFTFLLAVCPYLLATVVLVVKCCRLRGETSV
nr:Fc receptor-like protein 5 [Misgurnus anguillicaudatus]